MTTFMMVDPAHVATVGAAAAILYARVVWRSERDGQWVASHAEVAAETGLPVRAVRSAAGQLRDRGWLTTEQSGGYDRTTVWAPVIAGQAQGAEIVTCIGHDSSDGSDESVTFEVTKSALSSLETLQTETETPLIPPLALVPEPQPDLDAEFAAFWEHYPRKVGKKAARTAWARARRTTPLETIAAGLMAQLPEMRTRELRYVKHPGPWLNGEHWADVPEHVSPEPRTRDPFADPDGGAERILARLPR